MSYKQIYTSAIFEQSQCIYKENSLVEFMRTMLTSLDYQAVDDRRFVWQRGDRRVWLALVDDVEHLNYDYVDNFLDQFTSNDIIITDNWFNRPIRAQVLRLPDSWFGIYSHSPKTKIAVPTKQFAMPINRIDYNRIMVFLEMAYRGHITDQSLVNFNCARHTDNSDQQQLWSNNWDNVDPYYKEMYQSVNNEYQNKMPFRNHNVDIDSQCQMALVNVVVETYTGDNSVALSEKIFRALVTPRPWQVFSGSWTVARLEALGFDCMSDIVDHHTDGCRIIDDKISKFVKNCAENWNRLNWNTIANRCQAAAQHNQQLLKTMQRAWPQDFAAWWPTVVQSIA